MGRGRASLINLLSFTEEASATNRRRKGRIRCERLRSPGGRVLDISQTGARLIVHALSVPRVGQRRVIVFQTAMGPSQQFPAVVRWVRSSGVLRREVGVEFCETDDAKKSQLAAMGRVHGDRTLVKDMDRAA